jgi:hypothetical protein
MISFIVPFASNDGKLDYWNITDTDSIVSNTVDCISNINKTFSIDKEIILVDNTHNFPNIELPNLKIIKGWQGLDYHELIKQKTFKKYQLEKLNAQTVWASMAFNIGLQHAKGDHIVLQHNDIVYHTDILPKLIEQLEERYEYISVDSKKISLSNYVSNKNLFDKLLQETDTAADSTGFVNTDVEIAVDNGGYVKTTKVGLADAYFFFAKKEFFDDYIVDWIYGDTNHGATIKCLDENKKFLHIGPFYDNPNFSTAGEDRTYIYRGSKFLTHLKGGFSEGKMSHKIKHIDKSAEVNYNSYLKILNENI